MPIITTAAPEEWSAALELALCNLGAEVRSARVGNALTLIAMGEISSEGIFVARGPAGLCGVQICVPLPGASGLFWLPKTDPHDEALEIRLVQFALDWLGARGGKLAQAFLSPEDGASSRSLLHCGFRPVTRLHYLQHGLDRLPQQAPTRLRYTTYKEGNWLAFHGTLMRTYEATQDCPELNGVRTIDEIITGHKGQCGYRPELWWLAWEGSRPVGVALAHEVPDADAWDLSYLGVVPEARRRGLGRELASHVLLLAQKAHALKLVLGVDERNVPALQLYRQLGFLDVGFRDVYLKVSKRSLDDGCASPLSEHNS